MPRFATNLDDLFNEHAFEDRCAAVLPGTKAEFRDSVTCPAEYPATMRRGH